MAQDSASSPRRRRPAPGTGVDAVAPPAPARPHRAAAGDVADTRTPQHLRAQVAARCSTRSHTVAALALSNVLAQRVSGGNGHAGNTRLDEGAYPYRNLMSRRQYKSQKVRLQVELLKLQAWVKEIGQRVVILFWFSVSRAGQRRHFKERKAHPLKQWKLSPIDLASLHKWDDHTLAKESMFLHTDASDSPWTVIERDCKKRAPECHALPAAPPALPQQGRGRHRQRQPAAGGPSISGGERRGGVHAGQRGLRALLHRGPHVHGGSR